MVYPTEPPDSSVRRNPELCQVLSWRLFLYKMQSMELLVDGCGGAGKIDSTEMLYPMELPDSNVRGNPEFCQL